MNRVEKIRQTMKEREIDALKSLLVIANSDVPAPEMPETKDRKPALVNFARVSIITVAVVFIVLGIFNGGMSDVLGKAVRICTECIGLG